MGHDAFGRDLRLRVPANPTELASLRHRIADWARATLLSPDRVDDLTLATYEAMANVVDHAYRDSPGVLEVRGAIGADLASVTMTVVDHGRWLTPAQLPNSVRGRGLMLVRGLADDVEIMAGDDGTTVRMRWDLPAA